MINAEKYSRNVALLCPTCGGDQFEHQDGAETLTCAKCERKFTKDELIHENSEKISIQTKEVGNEVAKDIAAEMRNRLKNAFRGSNFIKIK